MTAESGERQRFGRYETLFRIAGGGMAEVYAARALGEGGFQKLVALKRMRPELAEDAKFVTMFLDEGRVAANIASPNVVSTLDLGRADDNSLYLVMELVTGAPLSALLGETMARSTRIPIDIAVDIVAQAANGLHAAHEARSPTGEPLEIVHRDCSPHNILVDVHGQVKITDFGIAKAMERQTSSHAGEMKGKLQYLSPEQARGLAVDRRSDIFILGIVAWEVLAGRQLFAADHPVEALHKIVTMPIPRLDEIGGVSADIAAAVNQALQREPSARFATAAAFGNALRNAYGTRAPAPTDVGAFVRKYGGKALHTVEHRVREALGAKPDSIPPPPSSAEHPIPLSLRPASRVDDARARAKTMPSVPPPPDPESDSAPDAAPGRVPPASRSERPRPRTGTEMMLEGTEAPRESEPPRSRTGTEMMPETRAGHPSLTPSALPSASPRGRVKTTPLTGSDEARERHGTAPLPKELPGWDAPQPPASPKRGIGGRVAFFAALAIVGGGGGAALAWWASRPPESALTTEDSAPTDPVATPPEPIAPVTVADAPGPTPPEDDSAGADPEETPEDDPDVTPTDPTPVRTTPRPRRNPRQPSTAQTPRRPPSGHTGTRPPGTVGGSDTAPRGDRETAFDEIPWDQSAPPRRR